MTRCIELAAGKKTHVFGVLTNWTDLRFFDTDGVVYATTKKTLEIGENGNYKSSSLSVILRWFT
jgi:hypothetical protein